MNPTFSTSYFVRSANAPTCARVRAAALLTTMLILVFITTLVLVLTRQMQTTAMLSSHATALAQAKWIEEGVERAILADLGNSIDNGENPALDFVETDAGLLGDGLYWILRTDTSQADAFGKPTFGLTPCNAKLNLNGPLLPIGEALGRLPQMDSDLTSVLLDWLDTDDVAGESGPFPTGGSGAESDYYLSQKVPYPAKNGPLDTIDEMLLLRGFDRSIVHGEDANQNGLLDDNEDDANASDPPDNADGRLLHGLAEFVTTRGQEPNTTASGQARVNVNGNNDAQQQLQQLLVQNLGEEKGQAVFQSIQQNRPEEDGYVSVLQIKTLVGNSLDDDEFEQIEALLTTSGDQILTGLVNAYFAPQEVLAAISDDDIARDVVNGRPAQPSQSLAWLLDALDDEDAATLAGRLTTRAYQFEAEIIAVSGDGRAFVRKWVVFETLAESGQETGTPRVVMREDHTHLGWPLDPDILLKLQQGESPKNVAAAFGSRIQ